MTPPASVDELVIEPLTEDHEVKPFKCRENDLTVYLKYQAKPSLKHGFGRTYVAVRPDDLRVWAYYTIGNTAILPSDLVDWPDKPPGEVPAVRLGRMAKDRRFTASGVSRFLLVHAFKMTVMAAQYSAAHCIVLDAKNHDLVKKVYEPMGFEPFVDKPLTLVLRVSLITDFLSGVAQAA